MPDFEEIRDNLNHLAHEIERSKEEKARLDGQLKEKMDALKRDYGIESLKEAEDKIKKLRNAFLKASKEVEQGWAYFEENYEWE